FQHPLQRWVQRSFFDLEEIVRHPLNVLHQGVAVQRLLLQRLQDHHLERAGKKIASQRLASILFCSRPRLNSPWGRVKQRTSRRRALSERGGLVQRDSLETKIAHHFGRRSGFVEGVEVQARRSLAQQFFALPG